MKITREWLVAQNACDDGIKLFDEYYPGGEADHDEILKRLSATEDEEISEFGQWLVDQIGFIDETLDLPDGYDGPALYYCGHVRTPKDIRTKFTIMVVGSVVVGGDLDAGGFVTVGGSVKAGHSVEAGWNMVVDGDVVAGGVVAAGWDMHVGGSVRAGVSVWACWSITACGEIVTGEGYGVYAGLTVPRELRSSQGFIRAKTKPNILSGHWAGDGE